MQRWLTASGEALIWGETGGALNDLHAAHLGWHQMLGSPTIKYKDGWGAESEKDYQEFISKPKSEQAHVWIANMCPPGESIDTVLRNTLIDIYTPPTIRAGYTRFGIKETRATVETAKFLRGLFPDAKFVFLVRDPIRCLTSIKQRNWMARPPGKATLHYHCMHWLSRAQGFRKADFGFNIKYEDFLSDAGLRKSLLDYLELPPPPDEFIKTSRTDWDTPNKSQLSLYERFLAQRYLGQEMTEWGYKK
jgi:hypothetical protein